MAGDGARVKCRRKDPRSDRPTGPWSDPRLQSCIASKALIQMKCQSGAAFDGNARDAEMSGAVHPGLPDHRLSGVPRVDSAVIVTESDGRGGAVTYGIRWREYWARAAPRNQPPVDHTIPRVGDVVEITECSDDRLICRHCPISELGIPHEKQSCWATDPVCPMIFRQPWQRRAGAGFGGPSARAVARGLRPAVAGGCAPPDPPWAHGYATGSV